jgi:membrane protease YdiL (CAAX protease family)
MDFLRRNGVLLNFRAFRGAVEPVGTRSIGAVGPVGTRSIGAARDAPLPLPLSATAGAATGLAFVLLSRPFLRARAMAAFRTEVRAAIGRPGPGTILVLAASSAIGEELLFRGALQALLGFWPTALIFALLHGGGARRLLGWTLFAGLAGLALGQLAAWTGSLLAPIIAHATVNQLNLEALSRLPAEEPS